MEFILIMAKKKNKSFSSGFGDLFSDLLEEQQAEVIVPSTPPKNPSKKNFSNSLESLFQEAIEDAVQEKAEQVSEGKPIKKDKRRTKPVFGLDSLIRQTVEQSEIKSDKKRVSFTFETEKIEKLRSIAKLEKARIRDIVNELITDYIQQHETKGA